jgi:GT2 family glycosyltransferase
MDISFIIVNYKRPDLIFDCIKSIREKTKFNIFEIIVVDNSSDYFLCKELTKFKNVLYVDAFSNIGFGRANNYGATFAKGKYLFLLNSDTLLLNDASKILYDAHESIDKAGIVCANLFDINLKPNHTYGMVLPEILTLFLYRFHLLKLFPNLSENFNHSNYPKKVKQIIGANMFLKRDLFIEISGFDHNFFMYVEDTELSVRISKMGLDLINIPEAKIIHLQGASSHNTNSIEREINSYTYFFLKYKSVSYLRAYILMELFQIFFKRAYFLLKGSKRYENLIHSLILKLRATFKY